MSSQADGQARSNGSAGRLSLHTAASASRVDDRAPDPVDLHVGDRVRRRRKALGVSQDNLAEQLGLTFQQVQKYERGANRVSASKLYQIASALEAPIDFFFAGLPDPTSKKRGVSDGSGQPFVHELPLTPEERELVGYLSRIESKRVRRKLLDLVRSMVEEFSGEEAD